MFILVDGVVPVVALAGRVVGVALSTYSQHLAQVQYWPRKHRACKQIQYYPVRSPNPD